MNDPDMAKNIDIEYRKIEETSRAWKIWVWGVLIHPLGFVIEACLFQIPIGIISPFIAISMFFLAVRKMHYPPLKLISIFSLGLALIIFSFFAYVMYAANHFIYNNE